METTGVVGIREKCMMRECAERQVEEGCSSGGRRKMVATTSMHEETEWKQD
jgi:hypothetical protein